MDLFKIDGVAYPNVHVMSIKRSAAVLDGDNAGRAMTGEMIRDIIGTYYNYSIEIDSDDCDRAEYDALYEVITAPADSHTFVMPYGQSTLTFKGYVSNADDELQYVYDPESRWGGLAFNMIAMAPARKKADA